MDQYRIEPVIMVMGNYHGISFAWNSILIEFTVIQSQLMIIKLDLYGLANLLNYFFGWSLAFVGKYEYFAMIIFYTKSQIKEKIMILHYS